MIKLPKRQVCLALLFVTCLVHGYLMNQWVRRWGFWGAIGHWFETFQDPISAAAGFDLMMCMLLIFVWMWSREGRWTHRLSLVLIPFVVFPAVGTLLYLVISDQSLRGSKSIGE